MNTGQDRGLQLVGDDTTDVVRPEKQGPAHSDRRQVVPPDPAPDGAGRTTKTVSTSATESSLGIPDAGAIGRLASSCIIQLQERYDHPFAKQVRRGKNGNHHGVRHTYRIELKDVYIFKDTEILDGLIHNPMFA